jgi:hypothetical protein
MKDSAMRCTEVTLNYQPISHLVATRMASKHVTTIVLVNLIEEAIRLCNGFI